MRPPSGFGEGFDLVLFFKYLSELRDGNGYGGSLNRSEWLTAAQRG